jgi:hypothetical protein
MNDTENFYKKFQIHQKYLEVLTMRLRFIELLQKSFIYLSMFLYNAPWIFTLTQFLFTGFKQLPSLMYFPYVDRTTVVGYFINFTVIALLEMLAFFGFITHDAVFLLYGCQAGVHVEVLVMKLKELEEAFAESKKGMKVAGPAHQQQFKQQKAKAAFHKQFIEYIKLYGEYREFLHDLGYFNSLPSFAAMSVSTVALCISSFITSQVSIVVGVPVSMLFFFQLAIPCIVGTMVTHQVSMLEAFAKFSHDMFLSLKTEQKVAASCLRLSLVRALDITPEDFSAVHSGVPANARAESDNFRSTQHGALHVSHQRFVLLLRVRHERYVRELRD